MRETLENYLCCYTYWQDDWAGRLLAAMLAINNIEPFGDATPMGTGSTGSPHPTGGYHVDPSAREFAKDEERDKQLFTQGQSPGLN